MTLPMYRIAGVSLLAVSLTSAALAQQGGSGTQGGGQQTGSQTGGQAGTRDDGVTVIEIQPVDQTDPANQRRAQQQRRGVEQADLQQGQRGGQQQGQMGAQQGQGQAGGQMNEPGQRGMRIGQQGQMGMGGQQVPPGYVLVPERTLFQLSNEPQIHFLQVSGYLSQKQPEQAAMLLRAAAAHLELQSAQASPQDRQQLMSQAQKLERYSEQVLQDKAPAAQDLNQTFARVNLSLAKIHHDRAQESLQQQQGPLTGFHLQMAGQSLRQALVWNGQENQQNQYRSLQQADQAAQGLLGAPGTERQAGFQEEAPGQAGRQADPQQFNQARQALQALSQDLQQIRGTLPAEGGGQLRNGQNRGLRDEGGMTDDAFDQSPTTQPIRR